MGLIVINMFSICENLVFDYLFKTQLKSHYLNQIKPSLTKIFQKNLDLKIKAQLKLLKNTKSWFYLV